MKIPAVKKNADFWSGLLLMLFSGAVINEAFNLEVGTPRHPGSGFMILGAATVLGILALLQFLKSLLFRQRPGQAPERIHPRRIISVIAANMIYIFVLESIGYLLSTFGLLCFLFQVYEKRKWGSIAGGAAAISFLTYVVFSRLLQLNLPKGLIRFF
jgi:putative tricarboxylic transport membrane protein